jgi:hypothetical protein
VKRKRIGIGLLVGALAVVAATLMLALPVAMGGFTPANASGHLSLKYRYVQNSDVCDNYVTASCVYCEYSTGLGSGSGVPPYGTNGVGSGKTLISVCSDPLTANNAKIAWKAHYLSYSFSYSTAYALNLNNSGGTLYPGQTLQFLFGINETYCYDGAIPDLVTISGTMASSGAAVPSVEIGLDGCG